MQVNLDEIKYGLLNSEQKSILETPLNLFEVPFNDIPLIDPPKNSSRETLIELKTIEKLQKEPKMDLEFVKECDKDMIEVFLKNLEKYNIKPPLWFDELKRQSEAVTLRLKDHFQRPRPYQLGIYRDVNFTSISSSSGHSPSYPSGHALKGTLIGHALARFTNISVFKELGERIALSRLQAGVHYPSDIRYGKRLGKLLLDNLSVI